MATNNPEQTTHSIPITKPYFGLEELEAVQKPLVSGWVVQGPYVQQFESAFSAYTGADASVATTSCTTALHIAVASLDLRPGDEVIVPAFTWVSTANVVEYMGATPVFCDIDLATFNINVSRIEDMITPRTVGLIPVHLFGLAADMEPIMEIARKHQLWVVEDAACALGAWYQGQHAGTFGDAGCFSFHPRKSITTGEGGMITTQHNDLAERARSLRDHGASRSDYDRHTEKKGFLLADYDELGYNYRMTDVQAALGCAQMERVDWILSERHRIARRYDEAFESLDWLAIPTEPESCTHGYQSYVCLFQRESPSMQNVDRLHQERNALMEQLEAEGIATRQGTHAAFMQGYYADKYGWQPEDCPNAWLADRLSLALPLYVQMTDLEQGCIIDSLQNG